MWPGFAEKYVIPPVYNMPCFFSASTCGCNQISYYSMFTRTSNRNEGALLRYVIPYFGGVNSKN